MSSIERTTRPSSRVIDSPARTPAFAAGELGLDLLHLVSPSAASPPAMPR